MMKANTCCKFPDHSQAKTEYIQAVIYLQRNECFSLVSG